VPKSVPLSTPTSGAAEGSAFGRRRKGRARTVRTVHGCGVPPPVSCPYRTRPASRCVWYPAPPARTVRVPRLPNHAVQRTPLARPQPGRDLHALLVPSLVPLHARASGAADGCLLGRAQALLFSLDRTMPLLYSILVQYVQGETHDYSNNLFPGTSTTGNITR
jgi:hypothetical protein